jgi:hypothetical protein
MYKLHVVELRCSDDRPGHRSDQGERPPRKPKGWPDEKLKGSWSEFNED